MKVHQKTALDSRESKVCEYLSFVDGKKLGYHFQLNYKLVVDNKVRLEAKVDTESVVYHWKRGLTHNPEALFQEFMA